MMEVDMRYETHCEAITPYPDKYK
ncbi:protein of unknown function [Rhodovastum atsumiense]|nr:protein of unknown function [Rhodovastum atsumiense]